MQLGKAHAGHHHRADARDRDTPAAVDVQAQVGIDRAPQRDLQLVATLDDVFGRDDGAEIGGAAGQVVDHVGAESRQADEGFELARARCDHEGRRGCG